MFWFRFIPGMFKFLLYQPLFFQLGFHLFCVRLAVHYFAIYSVSGNLIEQTLTATATSTMAV